MAGEEELSSKDVDKNDVKENLRMEYDLIKKGILSRYNRMYLADSIVISLSAIVILGCFEFRKELLITLSFPVGAILFFIILWMLGSLLYLHWTANKVTKVDYDMMKKINESFGRKGFVTEEIFNEKLRGKLWFEMRKWIFPLSIFIFIIINLIALITFLTA